VLKLLVAEHAEGKKHLARYMLRAPLSLVKMTYDAASATVLYRSKMHAIQIGRTLRSRFDSVVVERLLIHRGFKRLNSRLDSGSARIQTPALRHESPRFQADRRWHCSCRYEVRLSCCNYTIYLHYLKINAH